MIRKIVFAVLSVVLCGFISKADDVLTLTADSDWSGSDWSVQETTNLADVQMIDVAGHKLTVTMSADPAKDLTIKSSVAGGELRIVVPTGATVTNGKIALAEDLKVVKEGAGRFVPAMSGQTYTGGTEVLGGTLEAGGHGKDCHLGAANGTITVGPDTVFDLKGGLYFADYLFVLNGGTLYNDVKSWQPPGMSARIAWPWDVDGIKSIRVDADSAIDFRNDYSILDCDVKRLVTEIDLQGHALTVNFGGPYSYFCNLRATRGTLVLSGNIHFYGANIDGTETMVGPETTLDIRGDLQLEGDIRVGSYISQSTGSGSTGAYNVYVCERFKPVTDYFLGCVLMNGATLDLSGRTGAWNVKGMLTGTTKNTVTFEDNATITVDLGTRELETGDCVVEWNAVTKPANLETLAFVPAAGQSGEFVKRDEGLFFARAKAGAPTTATWIGTVGDGDLTNPQNWNCKDADGNVMTGAIPDIGTTDVTVTGETAFSCPPGTTAIWKTLTMSGNVTITTNCDWRGLGSFSLFVAENAVIDLNGHTLSVELTGSAGTACTFTDTTTDEAAPGELHLVVPEGETGTNSGATLSGNLRLVKEDAGTFDPAKQGQTYTGGTVVLGGTLNAGGFGKNRHLGTGDAITIVTNAVFDLKGKAYFADYTFILSGGTLYNNVNSRTEGLPWNFDGIKRIRVDSDSTIDFPMDYSIVDVDEASTTNPKAEFKSTIDLQGHTLTVNFSNNTGVYNMFMNVEATQGTIVLNGFARFFGGDFVGRETTFDVSGTLSLEADVHIGTYICRAESDVTWWNKDLYVYERFKPVTDNFRGCVLMNGATLDLSERTGAWNVKGNLKQANNFTKTSVTFEDLAVITVDLGERELQSGELVVAWDATTKPANFSTLKFKLPEGRNGRLVKRENAGLYFVDGEAALPATAIWTGTAGDGNLTNPLNWYCENVDGQEIEDAIPNAGTTAAIVTGRTSFNFPAGTAAIWKTIAMSGNVTITTNCDWRGLGSLSSFVAENAVIDLNGHTLSVELTDSAGTVCTFTDTTTDEAASGELRLNVPSGKTGTNSGATLSGNLRLVKEGAGRFVPAKSGQTYTGGTEVLGGTLEAGGHGKDRHLGAANGTITVGPDTVFDLKGKLYFADYIFILNGGTLYNNVLKSWQGIAFPWDVDGITRIRIDSESTIDFVQDYSILDYDTKRLETEIDLQGKTLTVNFSSEYSYFCNLKTTRGTMILNGAIHFYGANIDGPETMVGPETTLEVRGNLLLEGDIRIGTYISRSTGPNSTGAYNVYVCERFKPVTDFFWGCVLKNGATLDLSGRTEAWDVKGKLTGTPKNTVTFEDNAVITVDVGERKLKSGDKVVAWDATTKPANLATLKFKLPAGMGGEFIRTPEGLLFVRGVCVIIR